MQPHESARGPHVLRQINFGAVLRAVREHSPARVADLMQATGLSRPAVTRAVAELRDAGLVADVDETAQVSMGRPAQWIRFRAEVGHVVGVDVGSHKVIAMVADLAGRVVASRQVTIGEGATGARLLQSVRDTIVEALAKADLTGEDVWAIVVGTPGIVEETSGEVLLAPGIPGLAHLPVMDELHTLTPGPVLIENDINLAVLGERWCGAAVGSDSLVFVHWGVRIGAGILIDGKPYRGAHGAAGEIGFADVFSEPDAPDPLPLVGGGTSGVSEWGAFERMVGTQAIAELADAAHAFTERDPRALLSPDAVAAVFAAATEGDPTALAVVDRIAGRFARGLAAMLLVLDPREVIIGGGLSRAGETLLAAIERHLRPRILTSPRLVLSDLGSDAVALGAVRRALDHVEARLLAHPDA
ncbi:ROK family transcriptional regulator [Cryptosporangium aurantiacum]|uniref:Sugar kinase of the NBD/HSP70 family, may contain an N-terminal HTH domain n=1 Tax=Cryptosporangium aurantiacum TaxID=134849 RepID=A0A1M7QF97_9ACTN|nr:ROK family transcriptional regulator [Cryptosporangium aurantiacum]SHN29685.1 Sugar kinase of the NBD/HSP70 family, may contain an N-terminal HTH domain [Cryptosporangium aurantiacum]